MTDCVNSYLIDRHLKEQEDREAHEMRFVEAIDAFQCGGCGEIHLANAQAAKCCGADVEIEHIEDAYTCTKCGMVSDDLVDVIGHDHD